LPIAFIAWSPLHSKTALLDSRYLVSYGGRKGVDAHFLSIGGETGNEWGIDGFVGKFWDLVETSGSTLHLGWRSLVKIVMLWFCGLMFVKEKPKLEVKGDEDDALLLENTQVRAKPAAQDFPKKT